MIASPLEQFNITCLIPITVSGVQMSFTNSALYCAVAAGLVVALIQLTLYSGGGVIPSRWQSVVEAAFEFISSMVEEQIGARGEQFVALVFTTFMFILALNLMGMVPYSFSVTSHVIATFGLSCSLFIGVTALGVYTHGVRFLSFFLPAGAPLALAPLLVIIEVVSYVFRAVSLGVRLCANIASGHCLLAILGGFAWTMLCGGGALSLASIMPIAVVLAITGLELCVAFLQAYVFAVLLCVYLNDALHLH